MYASAFAVDETYSLDDVFEKSSGRVYATGMQALVRAALDQHRFDRRQGLNTAGFISGYRGSPVAGLDLVLGKQKARLDAFDIRFQPGLNEALAASTILGTQQVEATGKARYDGVFSMWYGKGPGVDWAGDALKHGNAYGSSPHGGVLAIAGDDHGAVSSTMAHQSDQTFKAWSMPVLNPANVDDYIDFALYGWALSRYSGAWVGFKAISETVEGAATIDLSPRLRPFALPDDFRVPDGGLHMRLVDPPSVEIETRLLAKIEAARAFALANRPDRCLVDPENARLAVLTVGKAHNDLLEALRRLGLDSEHLIEQAGIRILKIAQSWPVERHTVRSALRGVETALIVEEKRPLVEEQVIELLYRDGRPGVAVLGKQDRSGAPLLPASGELRPHIVAKALVPELERLMPGFDFEPRLRAMLPAESTTSLAKRTPYFCSGCPHNSSTVVPDGSIAFGGIGCHIMATWMDRDTVGVTQMGGEGSNWIGMAPFVETDHVFQNLGDGTYMHSGSLAIRAALAAESNITFKILFNDAVAMTGGQRHDGKVDVATITRQIHAEGIKRIVVVTDEPGKYPADADFAADVEIRHRRELMEVQEELRTTPGVTAMIFDQTCAAEKRRRRKRGEFPNPVKRVVINELVCEACGDCSKTSNCMSIQPLETPLGTKRQIDQSSCNKDFSCLEGFCPSFVTIEGAELAKPKGIDAATIDNLADGLPHPSLPAIENVFEILVTGIGGTGVLTVGALIGMAAHLENRRASVLDFTGLAQKGGAVLSHVRLASHRTLLNQSRIEPGQTDTLIACDLVTAADSAALATLARDKSRAVANAEAMITAEFVKNPSFALPLTRLKDRVAKRTREGTLPTVDALRLAEKGLGDGIGANVLMLGFAWQRGLLPLSLRSLERAIELNGVAVDANKRAFALGRIAAGSPEALDDLIAPRPALPETLNEMIAYRSAHLRDYQNAAYAERFETAVRRVETVDNQLAKTVAVQLFRLMAIKDEYEVARLHSDGRFDAKLREMFDEGYKKRFNLAPPLLSFWQDRPRKFAFGSWLQPVMKLLAMGRFLRGSIVDPFGHSQERRADRALVAEYEDLVEKALDAHKRGDCDKALKIAALPGTVRGFGHVRAGNLALYRSERDRILAHEE